MLNIAGRLFLREVFEMRDAEKKVVADQFSTAAGTALAPTRVEEMTMEEHGFYYVGVIDVGPGCLSQALMASMLCKDDKRILLPNQARLPGSEHHLLDFDAYAQRCQYEDVAFRSNSAVSSLRGTVYEEKILKLIKEKAKPNKKEISKDEAEKILKQSQLQEYSHPNKDEKKVEDKKLSSNKTKPKSTKIKPPVKKSKKVSKK